MPAVRVASLGGRGVTARHDGPHALIDCGAGFAGAGDGRTDTRLLAAAARRHDGLTNYLNDVSKYVVSSTLQDPEWERTAVRAASDIPALKSEMGGDIVTRVESVLVAGEAPDPRSLALASLVHGSRLTRRVVRPGVEYVAVRNAKRLPKHHREMAGFAVDTQDLAEELHGLITDIGDAAGAIVGGDASGDGGGGDGGSI